MLGRVRRAKRAAMALVFSLFPIFVELFEIGDAQARKLKHVVEGLLDGDAYDIDGWQRKLVKIAFNTMLNTSTAQQAQGAIANAIGGQGCYAKAATLMKAIGASHPDIVQFFNTGIGLRLQAVDANMAQAVILELLGKGIVVLPVHDVAEPYEGDVREAMERAFDSAP